VENIEFFDRFTLALLGHLYSEFPTPVEIETRSLGAGLLPDDINPEVAYNLLASVDHAVNFLEEEKFITHKGTYLEGGTFLQVRLTAKGLAVLNSVPESLEGRETLAARIHGLLSGGAKAAGTESVKQLVQVAFKTALGAAATGAG
jgi:hypothetical protein